jgi:hypothetical protein
MRGCKAARCLKVRAAQHEHRCCLSLVLAWFRTPPSSKGCNCRAPIHTRDQTSVHSTTAAHKGITSSERRSGRTANTVASLCHRGRCRSTCPSSYYTAKTSWILSHLQQRAFERSIQGGENGVPVQRSSEFDTATSSTIESWTQAVFRRGAVVNAATLNTARHSRQPARATDAAQAAWCDACTGGWCRLYHEPCGWSRPTLVTPVTACRHRRLCIWTRRTPSERATSRH